MNFKYVIVSPVLNEERCIEKTLQSVLAQSIPPMEWIIVDDGSTDATSSIVEGFLSKAPWIKLIKLSNRGFRFPGKGIVDAFYKGFETIKMRDWQFVVKLDCDLSFAPDYFERIFKEFKKNERLGIASGKTYLPVNGDVRKLELEWCPDTCTRGPSKIYKRECFEKIGGIRRERGWDTLDDIAAMVEGFEVRSFSNLKLIHYRPIGQRTGTHRGIKSRIQTGQNFYYIGYHPLFMTLKSIKAMITDDPKVLGGIAMLGSYFLSMIRKSPRIEDQRLIAKLQEVQLKRIFCRL